MTTFALGGTFDPIHNGHVFAAQCVSNLLGSVPVQMIVAGNPQLRRCPEASPIDRWEMLRLACADEQFLVPNDIELDHDKPTLTADTLALLQGSSSHPVVWLIGSDAVRGLSQWHRLEEIKQRASLIVLRRGEEPNSKALDDFVAVEDIESILDRSGSYFVVEQEMLDVSASRVRHQIKQDSPISSMVHPSVEEYIIRRKLYRT